MRTSDYSEAVTKVHRVAAETGRTLWTRQRYREAWPEAVAMTAVLVLSGLLFDGLAGWLIFFGGTLAVVALRLLLTRQRRHPWSS